MLDEVLLFIGTYFISLLLYEIFIVSKTKRRKNSKKFKHPTEVMYLINKGLDIDKVNYNQLLQVVALTSSLDITISVTLLLLVKNYVIAMLLGSISIIGTILISYELVFKFYNKKGMIK